MDVEIGLDNGRAGLDWEIPGTPHKVKSSLRMRYAAETKVFRDQHGGLENIRQKLGFSRRKMCQLLLVDPSAWTRWMRDETKVPPHIYRSLEWFLALNQKALTHPELATALTARYQVRSLNSESQTELLSHIQALKAELKTQRLVTGYLTAGLVAMALTLAGSLLF